MAVPLRKVETLVQELEQLKGGLQRTLIDDRKLTLVPKEFLQDLQGMKDAASRDFRRGKHGKFDFGDVSVPPEQRPQVVNMLKLLVYPEVTVAEQVARRIPQIPDLDLKARASQQVIDEVGHARVLREMLKGWGENPDELYEDPLPEIEAVFDYVSSLETPVEFFTANFMCEGLFLPTHLQVMSELDAEAFADYIDATLADEATHIALARDVILRYATTPEIQDRCRQVAKKVTELFIEGFHSKVKTLMNGTGREIPYAS